MTPAAPALPSPPHRSTRMRWLFVLAMSLVLHFIFFSWMQGTLTLPSPSSPTVQNAPEIVSATLVPAAQPMPAMANKPARQANKVPRRPPAPPPQDAPIDESFEPILTHAGEPFHDMASPLNDTVDSSMAATDMPSESAAHADAETAALLEKNDGVPTYAAKPPPPAILKFDIRKTPKDGADMHGSGTISWQRVEDTYQIQGEFGVLFITALRFSSKGTLDRNGIVPELYAEKRLRRSETNTHFHRERETVSFSASTQSYPRTGKEQDRASVIWQLAGIGRSNPDLFQQGLPLTIMVAGVRDMQPWKIDIQGRDTLMIEGQEQETWHLVRTPRPGSYDQKLEIWLAPTRDWYPVRLRYTEPNGDVLDMVMTNLNVSPSSQSQ